jgi:hypothetical protein
VEKNERIKGSQKNEKKILLQKRRRRWDFFLEEVN